MYRSLNTRDLFGDLDRLQREMSTLFDMSPGIRGFGRGGYPALNIGSTPTSVEVWAFAPGLEADSIAVDLERGVLSLSGERKSPLPDDDKSTVHQSERFTGRFRRVISLSDDIDPSKVEAKYRDGVLRVSIQRKESAQPRRIAVN